MPRKKEWVCEARVIGEVSQEVINAAYLAAIMVGESEAVECVAPEEDD